jgi:hypothetical protein
MKLNLTHGAVDLTLLFCLFPLQEIQTEAAAREGERRFGFDNDTAPLGQIYVSVFFSFVFF